MKALASRLWLALLLAGSGLGRGQGPAPKPVVVVEHFEIAVQDSVLRAVTDRITGNLIRALGADTSIRLVPRTTPAASRPAGPAYRVNGGTSPRPDGSLRLDWALTSLETRAVVARDSMTVTPSRERRVVAAVAARISAALHSR